MIFSFIARFLWWWTVTLTFAVSFKPRARASTLGRQKPPFWVQLEDWSTSDELVRSSGRQCFPQWVERGFPDGRLLFHPAQKCACASQVHAGGRDVLGPLSHLLSDLSFADGNHAFSQAGLV